MTDKGIYKMTGGIILIATISLAWYWFGYQLPIIVILAKMGGNLIRE